MYLSIETVRSYAHCLRLTAMSSRVSVSVCLCQLTECTERVPSSPQPLLASRRQSSPGLASLELPESSPLSEIQYLLVEIHSVTVEALIVFNHRGP